VEEAVLHAQEMVRVAMIAIRDIRLSKESAGLAQLVATSAYLARGIYFIGAGALLVLTLFNQLLLLNPHLSPHLHQHRHLHRLQAIITTITTFPLPITAIVEEVPCKCL
jgi:hypothetical protein